MFPSHMVYILKASQITQVKFLIKEAELVCHQGEILDEVDRGMKWFNKQFDKCYEAVKDAMTLIEQSPRPEAFQEDFEIETLEEYQIENEVWKLVNPFSIPSAEDIADQVILKLSCWQESGQYKKINFV
jgi:hypothetical protein